MKMRGRTDQVTIPSLGSCFFALSLMTCPISSPDDSRPRKRETAVATKRYHRVCGCEEGEREGMGSGMRICQSEA